MEKIYKEHGTNCMYVFNSVDLKKSFYAFLLKSNKDHGKRLTREELYHKLGKSLYLSPESVRKHISGFNTPNDIKIVYGYGEFLENGDRYAFLKLRKNNSTSTENTWDILACDNFTEKCVNAVYSTLIKLLFEYSASHCFTKAPDDSESLLYYRGKVDKIESLIKQLRGHNDLKDKMLSITGAIKKMICTCNFPGVPSSWYKINPNLRFYTAGFCVMVEAPDFYKKIKNRETWSRFDYYTEESEIELCYEYFASLYKKNGENNYHYNMDDFFQQELINTVKIIFETNIDPLILKNR